MYMFRVIAIPSDLDIQVILNMFRVIAILSDLDIQVILNMYMFRVIAIPSDLDIQVATMFTKAQIISRQTTSKWLQVNNFKNKGLCFL